LNLRKKVKSAQCKSPERDFREPVIECFRLKEEREELPNVVSVADYLRAKGIEI